jgi:hypothetical protein
MQAERRITQSLSKLVGHTEPRRFFRREEYRRDGHSRALAWERRYQAWFSKSSATEQGS